MTASGLTQQVPPSNEGGNMYNARGLHKMNSARCFLKHTEPINLTKDRNPTDSLPGEVSAKVPAKVPGISYVNMVWA